MVEGGWTDLFRLWIFSGAVRMAGIWRLGCFCAFSGKRRKATIVDDVDWVGEGRLDYGEDGFCFYVGVSG